jgi:HEAT repeat protein
MRFSTIFLAGGMLFAQSPADKAWPLLEAGVHHTNPLKRMQAISAMSVLRPDNRVSALLEPALQDKTAGVRVATCNVLGEIKSRASIPKLQDALKDTVNEVVFAAAKALYNMNDPSGRSLMEAILLGTQADSSGFFAGGMRDLKLKLHDPKQALLLGAQGGASFFGGGAGVPLAEGLMKDKNASGQTVAALLLVTDTTPESLDALRQSLKAKNWTVRAAAARAVAMRNADSLYDDVASLLTDKKEEVTFSAAASLIRLKQPVSATD